MLDMLVVAGQLRRMREELAGLADEREPRLRAALSGWDLAAAMGPALRDRVLLARTSWLVAEPLEPLRPYPVERAPPYRVVASDGSQVFPDRHELPHCYLVNTGLVDIDYAAPTAALESKPSLVFMPEEMYPLVGGFRQEADARVVGATRFAAECEALARALESVADATVLVMDGTLLVWWLEPDPDRLRGLDPSDLKARTFESLRRLLAEAHARETPVAGYLSSPGSSDVVSLIKVVLCTEDPVDCDKCPYDAGKKLWSARHPAGRLLPRASKPCEEAETVTDAAMFASVLSPRERSPRFRSAARITSAYDAPIDFVYLHTGAEVARVEFPAWVTPANLEFLASALLDQCDKGRGYPVALAEAHEQAVVKGPERTAFLDLVRRMARSRVSLKLQRKRTGVV
jgi:hypothetical protein